MYCLISVNDQNLVGLADSLPNNMLADLYFEEICLASWDGSITLDSEKNW